MVLGSAQALYTGWVNGDILAAGSIFTATSGTTFVSGLNHAYNAINKAPRIVYYSSGIFWNGGATTADWARIGSWAMGSGELAPMGDYLQLRMTVGNFDGGSRHAIRLRYSGASVGEAVISTAQTVDAQRYDGEYRIYSNPVGLGSSDIVVYYTSGLEVISASNITRKDWLAGSSIFYIEVSGQNQTGSSAMGVWVYKMSAGAL